MALTDQEILEFKRELLEIREKLLGALKDTDQEIRESSRQVSYSSDADSIIGYDDLNTCREGSEQTLRLVERALEKVEEGTYGICDFTKEPIPIARLKIMPYAIMTVEAQSKKEKRRG